MYEPRKPQRRSRQGRDRPHRTSAPGLLGRASGLPKTHPRLAADFTRVPVHSRTAEALPGSEPVEEDAKGQTPPGSVPAAPAPAPTAPTPVATASLSLT